MFEDLVSARNFRAEKSPAPGLVTSTAVARFALAKLGALSITRRKRRSDSRLVIRADDKSGGVPSTAL